MHTRSCLKDSRVQRHKRCICFNDLLIWVLLQIEGTDKADQYPLGSEYYTTLRSEADNDVNAATVASEEAEADINR